MRGNPKQRNSQVSHTTYARRPLCRHPVEKCQAAQSVNAWRAEGYPSSRYSVVVPSPIQTRLLARPSPVAPGARVHKTSSPTHPASFWLLTKKIVSSRLAVNPRKQERNAVAVYHLHRTNPLCRLDIAAAAAIPLRPAPLLACNQTLFFFVPGHARRGALAPK